MLGIITETGDFETELLPNVSCMLEDGNVSLSHSNLTGIKTQKPTVPRKQK